MSGGKWLCSIDDDGCWIMIGLRTGSSGELWCVFSLGQSLLWCGFLGCGSRWVVDHCAWLSWRLGTEVDLTPRRRIRRLNASLELADGTIGLGESPTSIKRVLRHRCRTSGLWFHIGSRVRGSHGLHAFVRMKSILDHHHLIFSSEQNRSYKTLYQNNKEQHQGA